METVLLVLALSLDAFVASLAYGARKIKIPLASIIIINIVCTFLLTISILGGSIIKKILPGNIALMISFTILMLLGIYYLFEGVTKADYNHSNDLDSKEAIYLAIALSLDSLAVGFGSSSRSINYINVIVLSLIIGVFSIWIGLLIGEKVARKSKINLSWLAGIILIVLACLKLV